MKGKSLCFIILFLMLPVLYSCENGSKEKMWDIEQYQSIEDIVNIEKLEVEQPIVQGIAVSTYKVQYKSDDFTVVSYLCVPDLCIKEKQAYPCIIYNRGGNRWFGANTPEYITRLGQSTGKIIFATQYRGVDGGTGKDEFGGDDLNDVLKLIDLCEEFAFVDMQQLYMMGVSRGGMMTYMAVREDTRIKKAVVVSGVSDIFMSYNERTDMQQVIKQLVGHTPDSNPQEFEKRSAAYWADEIKCPILIIHSKLDERVSFDQAEKMVKALEDAGKKYKFIGYKDDVHGFHEEDLSIIMEWCQ